MAWRNVSSFVEREYEQKLLKGSSFFGQSLRFLAGAPPNFLAAPPSRVNTKSHQLLVKYRHIFTGARYNYAFVAIAVSASLKCPIFAIENEGSLAAKQDEYKVQQVHYRKLLIDSQILPRQN